MSNREEAQAKDQRIQSYRDLQVWQRSMKLVTNVYQLTRSFPSDEQYGLSAQIRHCAVSIPSNMAEGYGRGTTNDYVRFLRISMGSMYELQTQLEIALSLGYATEDAFNPLYNETRDIERMLSALISKLKTQK